MPTSIKYPNNRSYMARQHLSSRKADTRKPKTRDIHDGVRDHNKLRKTLGYQFRCLHCDFKSYVYEDLDTANLIRSEHLYKHHPDVCPRSIKDKLGVKPTGRKAVPGHSAILSRAV